MQLRHFVDLRPSFQLHHNQSAELTPTALALKLVYARSVSTHVTQQLVESMPSAGSTTTELCAFADLAMKETHTKSVKSVSCMI